MIGGESGSRFVRTLFACLVAVGLFVPAGCQLFQGSTSRSTFVEEQPKPTISGFVGSDRLDP